ncbi:MAG: hypothetical protein D6E12_09305 [Desulfovibrio sp.]|mgnify:CR=1 FL=1|nr:MAG: hypothetical protein D6E12_09305 [Desulfovibrio sp.]
MSNISPTTPGPKETQHPTPTKEQQEVLALAKAVAASPYVCLVAPDQQGRIIHKLEKMGDRTIRHEYKYDADGRLTQVKRDGTITEEYRYDDQGRRSYDHVPERAVFRRSHEYDANDRLLRAGGKNFEYDSLGRMLKRHKPGGSTYFLHTNPGFLGSTRLPDGIWAGYVLDHNGRPTQWQYNDERHLGFSFDRQGRLSVVHEPRKVHNWYFSYSNYKARLPSSMHDVEGNVYVLAYDHLSSLRAVIGPQGDIVKEINYDSFGNILRETGHNLRIPLGFAGGMHDRITGLVKFRFRDYMPDVGRFTAKDPIGYRGGDSDLYGYCLDDPVNSIDPSGLRKSGWQKLDDDLSDFWDAFVSIPDAFYQAGEVLIEDLPPALEGAGEDIHQGWVFISGDKGEPSETTLGDRLLHTSVTSGRAGMVAGDLAGSTVGGTLGGITGQVVGGAAAFNLGLFSQIIAEITGNGDEVYAASRNLREAVDDVSTTGQILTSTTMGILGDEFKKTF